MGVFEARRGDPLDSTYRTRYRLTMDRSSKPGRRWVRAQDWLWDAIKLQAEALGMTSDGYISSTMVADLEARAVQAAKVARMQRLAAPKPALSPKPKPLWAEMQPAPRVVLNEDLPSDIERSATPSGFVGVYAQASRWRAHAAGGKRVVGLFDTATEAALARYEDNKVIEQARKEESDKYFDSIRGPVFYGPVAPPHEELAIRGTRSATREGMAVLAAKREAAEREAAERKANPIPQLDLDDEHEDEAQPAPAPLGIWAGQAPAPVPAPVDEAPVDLWAENPKERARLFSLREIRDAKYLDENGEIREECKELVKRNSNWAGYVHVAEPYSQAVEDREALALHIEPRKVLSDIEAQALRVRPGLVLSIAEFQALQKRRRES